MTMLSSWPTLIDADRLARDLHHEIRNLPRDYSSTGIRHELRALFSELSQLYCNARTYEAGACGLSDVLLQLVVLRLEVRAALETLKDLQRNIELPFSRDDVSVIQVRLVRHTRMIRFHQQELRYL